MPSAVSRARSQVRQKGAVVEAITPKTVLISVMRHGLTVAGRYLVMRTKLPDLPGELIKLLSLVAEERGNVIAVDHHREGMDIPVSSTEVELTLVTRDEEHCRAVAAEYPDRLTRIVSPFAPGGGLDVVARLAEVSVAEMIEKMAGHGSGHLEQHHQVWQHD